MLTGQSATLKEAKGVVLSVKWAANRSLAVVYVVLCTIFIGKLKICHKKETVSWKHFIVIRDTNDTIFFIYHLFTLQSKLFLQLSQLCYISAIHISFIDCDLSFKKFSMWILYLKCGKCDIKIFMMVLIHLSYNIIQIPRRLFRNVFFVLQCHMRTCT